MAFKDRIGLFICFVLGLVFCGITLETPRHKTAVFNEVPDFIWEDKTASPQTDIVREALKKISKENLIQYRNENLKGPAE